MSLHELLFRIIITIEEQDGLKSRSNDSTSYRRTPTPLRFDWNLLRNHDSRNSRLTGPRIQNGFQRKHANSLETLLRRMLSLERPSNNDSVIIPEWKRQLFPCTISLSGFPYTESARQLPMSDSSTSEVVPSSTEAICPSGRHERRFRRDPLGMRPARRCASSRSKLYGHVPNVNFTEKVSQVNTVIHGKKSLQPSVLF